jgi:alanine racemase
MVMNPSLESIDLMLSHDLEPEIYNFRILKNLIQDLRGRKCRIHIKLDTGMHRLGFEEENIPKLKEILNEYPEIEVVSVFSHLAGADAAEHREFTHQQALRFEKMSAVLCGDMHPQPLRHLLNSPGIINYPEYQYDMVRLGIGLYGIDASHQEQDQLSPISRLRTVISQVKRVKKGDSIGYDRKGRAQSDRIIATIAIGYADGFSRSFSNSKGEVWVNGSRAPVIGNVCMDMTMIDITGISASEGDEVEIFGSNISISEMAEKIETIPYEILTNVSQRVRRVFISE